MSQFRTENMVCPACNKKAVIKLYERVDSTDAAARNSLLKGSIFRYKCSKCGYMTNIGYNLLYRNDEKHFMIYMAADRDVNGMKDAMDNIEKRANEMAPSKDFRYNVQRRIVLDSNELREKVIILEADLDDRVLEIMKHFYSSAVLENNQAEQIIECLFVIEDGEWAFEFIVDNGNHFEIPIKKELYETFKTEYSSYFSEHNEYFVNSDWAMNIYQKHEDDLAGEE